ncbi:hypothetical protein RFI_15886, partial [Reticulomyxa filosa]
DSKWKLLQQLCRQYLRKTQEEHETKQQIDDDDDDDDDDDEEEPLRSYRLSMSANALKQCRQDHYNNDNDDNDDNDNGVSIKCKMSEKEILEMQMEMKSSDVDVNPKHVLDWDVYLKELWLRAHQMNESFQMEMKEIFKPCKGCRWEEGPVKTLESYRRKAQMDYDCEVYPFSAHVLDIVRCRVTFDTPKHLVDGLKHFVHVLCSAEYQQRFRIVRIKNAFAAVNPLLSTTRTRTLYKDIKVNVQFRKICAYNRSQVAMVTEVQFTLHAIAQQRQVQQHSLFRFLRSEMLHLKSSKDIQHWFDFQLQSACFESKDIANLMYHCPRQFALSPLVQHFHSAGGDTFLSQMANNGQVQFPHAQTLLQSGSFIPFHVVQTQLVQDNHKGTFPLMHALWKQPSIDCIKLFIPSYSEHAKMVWYAANRVLFTKKINNKIKLKSEQREGNF